jgi:UDP-glucose 4-epimerase
MKILVTGGAGFIGSHVVDNLVDKYEVIVLDDLSGGFIENVNPKAEFIRGSICDTFLVNYLFETEKFDYVFHLAAYAAEGLSHFIKKFNYENNLLGSINLINASVNNNIKCFVFTSSIAVYGTSPELPMTELTLPNPEDSYGIAKLAIEQELKVCKEMFDLNYIIFRPHNVYGERQNIGDKYRNVVGIFMNQLLQNKPMTIFGEGNQKRAFSYIGDVAPIIAKSIEVPEAYNQIINIGADHPYTILELATVVAKAMNKVPNIKTMPARNEVLEAYSLHDKMKSLFGNREQYTLEEGLIRMAKWVKEHGSRNSQKFNDIEITKNFPKAWLE